MWAILDMVAPAVLWASLAWAAWSDFRGFRIPNWTSGAITVAFFIGAMLTGTIGLPSHLAAALVVFAGATLLFMLRLWGAGDVKLITAVALWAGWDNLLPLILAISLAGGLLAAAVIVLRYLPLHKVSVLFKHHPPPTSGDVPYGLAIAAGAAFVFLYGGAVRVPFSLW